MGGDECSQVLLGDVILDQVVGQNLEARVVSNCPFNRPPPCIWVCLRVLCFLTQGRWGSSPSLVWISYQPMVICPSEDAAALTGHSPHGVPSPVAREEFSGSTSGPAQTQNGPCVPPPLDPSRPGPPDSLTVSPYARGTYETTVLY